MIGVTATGVDYGVIGNATLTADFASETLDVAFTDVHRSPGLLATDGDLPVPLADMRFDDVPMSSDGLIEDERAGEFNILGHWYGPNHVEAGGIFEHYGRDISGSFGASRQ
ncbi:MAG: transferrin-binding protein-like solute binding protein [Gammaproteobacteria bacterium]|nr:transferrin-binding protein-like solute binding protein [Gammaproteobacteria bacterium]